MLRRGRHPSLMMQSEFDAHGETSFSVIAMRVCSLRAARAEEKKLILAYKPEFCRKVMTLKVVGCTINVKPGTFNRFRRVALARYWGKQDTAVAALVAAEEKRLESERAGFKLLENSKKGNP
jgi:hypothetical protein